MASPCPDRRIKGTTLSRLTATTAPAAARLIRAMVGAVFLSEGVQQFLFPEQVGAGLVADGRQRRTGPRSG